MERDLEEGTSGSGKISVEVQQGQSTVPCLLPLEVDCLWPVCRLRLHPYFWNTSLTTPLGVMMW